MIRREDAKPKFGADGRVGRVCGGIFQIAGVLNCQDMFVGVAGVGGFYGGRFHGVALAGLLRGGAGGKCSAHGGEGERVGSGPAFELHRGQIRGVLHGRQNDVGAAKFG